MQPIRPFSQQLTPDKINPRVVNAQYAVRGEVPIAAGVLEGRLKAGEQLPFKHMTYCNIGNPHQLGQVPITFPRQVMALCNYPELATSAPQAFPRDMIERSRSLLAAIDGGIGAYSHSKGLAVVRQHVADFLQRRDGFPADPENIFLTAGASPGISYVLNMLIRGADDTILIPTPQYPLYSATIALLGGHGAGYFLNEETGWSLSLDELEQSYAKAMSANPNGTVRALVIINPGNPTGGVLDEAQMRDVLRFCHRRGLVLLADEVYQENIYDEKTKWSSFKKVLCSMESDIAKNVELFSFHSVSKGFFGECGRRGGYLEAVNIHPDAMAQLYKVASIGLCPPVDGQLIVDCMVRPPVAGEESYELYSKQRSAQLASLGRRAGVVSEGLKHLEGVSCAPITGSMYAFPSIRLPPGAVAAAKAAGKAADTFYCLELLKNTGIVVVPGSGFGQRDGTWHFRTTILPPESGMAEVMERMAVFHKKFLATYK